MTVLLALGWPLAAFFAWRWRLAVRVGALYQESADSWEEIALAAQKDTDDWRDVADRANQQAATALTLADGWRTSALIMQAAALQPFRTDVGNVQ